MLKNYAIAIRDTIANIGDIVISLRYGVDLGTIYLHGDFVGQYLYPVQSYDAKSGFV